MWHLSESGFSGFWDVQDFARRSVFSFFTKGIPFKSISHLIKKKPENPKIPNIQIQTIYCLQRSKIGIFLRQIPKLVPC
jgi:hypothetical protein